MWLPLAFQSHCHWIAHAVSFPTMFSKLKKTQNWRIRAKNGDYQGQLGVAMVTKFIQQQYKFLRLMWLPLAFQSHCHWIAHAVSFPTMFTKLKKTQNWRICAKNGDYQGQLGVATVTKFIQQQYKFLSLMWLPVAFQGHCHWITHAFSFPAVFLHFQKTQNWGNGVTFGESKGQLW